MIIRSDSNIIGSELNIDSSSSLHIWLDFCFKSCMARFRIQAILRPKVQIPLKQREQERTQGPPSFLQGQPTWS